METRGFVTDIPNQINKQIQQNTQKYDVNTTGVREVISDGLDPITITELGTVHDQQVRPDAPTLRYSKSFVNGNAIITLMIDFNGKDELGNDISDRVMCDIFRDNNNNGYFDSDEILDSIDLKKTNVFYDRNPPQNSIVRYRVLAKNMVNGKQKWSTPVIIGTMDSVTPYTPSAPTVITNGVNTVDEKNNTVTAIIKVEKHMSNVYDHMELYFKQVGQSDWSAAVILDDKIDTISIEETLDGETVNVLYYMYSLSGLSRSQWYSVRVRAVTNTGKTSAFSAQTDFMAGDFVAPAPPREVKAVSICDTTALKVETTWKAALELYDAKDVVKYQLYRLRWLPTASAFSDIPELVTEITVDQNIEKELYTYTHTLDSSDENKWYVYMVRSVDSFNNTSAFIYSQLIQAIVEVDSANIWIDWTSDPEEAHNFPMRIIWKYTIPSTGFGQSYGVDFIRNTDNSILASFRVADDSTKKITYEGETGCTYLDLTIDMFNEEAVKEFLSILNWQESDNYGVRITASLYDVGGHYTTKAISNFDGQETFLINPRPGIVTGFTAAYSNVDHQVKFKWNKNTFSSLTGYIIKQISGLDYESLLAHPTDSSEDRTIRLDIWNGGTVIADDKVLKKDITTYNYKLTEAINPVAASEIFFLIKPVGNFLNTEKYSDINTRKIYSDEAANARTILSSILPAPSAYSALMYNAEMKVDWAHEYEFRNEDEEIIYPEIAKNKLKEFIVYMSTNAAALADNIPNDKYKVYSGVKSVCVFSDYINPNNPPNRIKVERGVTYYFKIIPFDSFGYAGLSTPVFASTTLATPSALPQPRIIGASKPRIVSLPFGDVSWAQSGTVSVDVYNNRNFQVEIGDAVTGTFVKDRNVDRIKFYWFINKTFTYIEGMDLLLSLSSAEISQEITMKSIRKSFALPADKTIFRIAAVQSRGDVEEGLLTKAIPTNYSIIDTQAPSLDITKVVYTSDGTNAINKNNYINKKILSGTGGIDVYFNAYEKEPNSQIQKVEYSLTEGSWITATLSDGKFHITNAQIGNDTDSEGKYRDIQILVRAFDNADNTCDRAITFRKDTVGPSADDLPTGLIWAFGKTLKLAWTNPKKQDRNLFDGLRLFVGNVLNEAKEYNLDSSPFEFIPGGDIVADKTLYLFLAAKDIADNLTYLDYAGNIQANQDNPTAIEIVNAPPAAPVTVLVESQVGGVGVSWPEVTTDEDGNPEEVKKYIVEYSLAESSPSVWESPEVDETYTTNISFPLSATELDQFTANTALRLYVRVKAVDYWDAESEWSDSTGSYARPKNITAVDMGNNIFKFKLTSDSGLTLLPYVGADQTGTTEHILDANYLDNEFVRFTINNTTNNYLKIDLNKVEWISDLKLKFKHTTNNIRFVIKLEEVTSTGTQDVWLQSASTSNHDFSEIDEIVISSSKPDPDRYFEYSTTDSGVGDMALFHYENFTTKKAILAKSISIYFYSANATTVNMVEFQPVITSIANIFYGSEINLDYMVSIRSKADLTNYTYLDKYGLGIYGSSALKATVGRFYNGSAYVYGAWLSDNVYIGGSSPANAAIKIVSNAPSITVGQFTSDSSSTIVGIADSKITANSSSTEIKQVCNIGWAQFTNEYLAFGTGTYGVSPKTKLGKLSSSIYGVWLSDGVYIGGTDYTNAVIKADSSGKVTINSTANSTTGTISVTQSDAGGSWDAITKCYSAQTLSNFCAGFYCNSSVTTASQARGFYHDCNITIDGATASIGFSKRTKTQASYSGQLNVLLMDATELYSGASLIDTLGFGITCNNSNAYEIYSYEDLYIYASENLRLGTSGGYTYINKLYGNWTFGYAGDYASSTWRAYFVGNVYVSGYLATGSYYQQEQATPQIILKNTSAYSSPTYGEIKFSGYINSSNTVSDLSSICGGKTNNSNNDYKGYLEFKTSWLSTSIKKTRMYIGASGKISIGTNSGAISTNNTENIGEDVTNYLVSVSNVADTTMSGALHVNGYGVGVNASSQTSRAVYAMTAAAGQFAIYGVSEASNSGGVHGESTSGRGVDGYSATDNGVVGRTGNGRAYGGLFQGASTSGLALRTEARVIMANLASGTGTALVISSNEVKVSSSSIRYKTILDYANTSYSMEKFMSLTPYFFRFKQSGDYDIGFIAEHILDIFPDLVIFNQSGQPEALKYDRFCVYNILATQEHDRIIKQQQNEIIALKNEIDEIKNLLKDLLK